MSNSQLFSRLENENVFVDTSAWFSLLSKSDRNHDKIKNIYQKLLENNNNLVLSNHVLGETFTLIRYKVKNSNLAFKFIDLVNKSIMINKIFIEEKTDKKAIKILENYKDQQFSYVDATSFAVMNKLELKYALSLDTHFATAGFIIP
jgi:predicted nucleic acid-binding protein